MTKVLLLILMCITLSSCETLNNIQNSDLVDKIGNFQLTPVQPNNYWYNGKSYEYNAYQIEITSGPVRANIKWDGKSIGTTPMVYSYSGTLNNDDNVRVRAIPLDENIPSQEAVLNINKELPRKIQFDLNKK